MLIDKNISIHILCQQFECKEFEITEEKSVLRFKSTRDSKEETCPFCGGRVHVYDNAKTTLKDMPIWHGLPLGQPSIRVIHESVMQESLDMRRKELRDKDNRPRHLAVDEFAIHKGHSYRCLE